MGDKNPNKPAKQKKNSKKDAAPSNKNSNKQTKKPKH